MNRNNSHHVRALSSGKKISFLTDAVVVAGALVLLVISGLYFLGAWNLQWTAGHLLIPAADDWQDIDAFANYLTGRPYFDLMFLRYMGHPELFVKIITFIYLELGLHSYQKVIAVNVLLQLIPAIVYFSMLRRAPQIPMPLKLLLLPIPVIFMFDGVWWSFFHIIKGFLWAYGYVFVYLALFMVARTKTTLQSSMSVALSTLLAFVACQFFVAAYAIWPALFYFAYASRWEWKKYLVLVAGMSASFGLYLLMRPTFQDMPTRLWHVLQHPLQFIAYLILIFGDDGVFNHEGANIFSTKYILVSAITFSLSLFFILKNIIRTNLSQFERFTTALLIFSFLVIFTLAYGRLEDTVEASPFHYAPCIVALYIPLITLLALAGYNYIGRWIYPVIFSLLSLAIFNSIIFNAIFHNQGIFMPPSASPDYERMSLMFAAVADSSSFESKQPASPSDSTFINTMAKYRFGFIRWPALSLLGKTIDKDISIQQGFYFPATCSGEIIKNATYQLTKWKILELTGWAWNSKDDAFPKTILITDGRNKIIGVADGENTQPLWQVEKKSTWLAYIPFEKLKINKVKLIKLWVMNNNEQACFIKQYPLANFDTTKPVSIFAANDLQHSGFIP